MSYYCRDCGTPSGIAMGYCQNCTPKEFWEIEQKISILNRDKDRWFDELRDFLEPKYDAKSGIDELRERRERVLKIAKRNYGET